MDAATAWLLEHDPDPSVSQQSWKDINEAGDYEPPHHREVSVGGSGELADLEASGAAVISDYPRIACNHCGTHFAPAAKGQKFCSDLCKEKSRPRRNRRAYMRAYMQDYRKKQKPTPLGWDLGILPDGHPFKDAA